MCSITSPVFIINQKNANFHGLIDETEYVDACTGTRRSLLQGCDGGLGCSTHETQTSDCRRNHRAMPVTNIQALQLCAKRNPTNCRDDGRCEERRWSFPPPNRNSKCLLFSCHSACLQSRRSVKGALTTALQSGCARGFRAEQLYVRLDLDGINRCENGWASPTMGSLEWEVVTLSFQSWPQ